MVAGKGAPLEDSPDASGADEEPEGATVEEVEEEDEPPAEGPLL